MNRDHPLIGLLKLTPFVVLVLTVVHPYAAVPVFVGLAIFFLIALFKVLQEMIAEYDRDDYYTAYTYYHNEPYEDIEQALDRQSVQYLSPHLHVLRLPWPCTLDDLNRAYRHRARQSHPDMPNGNHQEFIQVREAYEVLREYFKEQGESARNSAKRKQF